MDSPNRSCVGWDHRVPCVCERRTSPERCRSPTIRFKHGADRGGPRAPANLPPSPPRRVWPRHHHHQITLALQFPALSPCAPHPLVEPRVPGGGRLARTDADTSSDPLSFAVGSIELTGRPAARRPGLDAGAFRRGGGESRSISGS